MNRWSGKVCAALLIAAGWLAAGIVARGQDIVVEQDGVVVEIRGAAVDVKAVEIQVNQVAVEAKAADAKAGEKKKKDGADGDDKAEGEKETEEGKRRTFPPKVEEAIAGFLDDCVKARREPAQEEIEAEIEKLVEFHELDEAAAKKLKELSPKAVEASLAPWREAVDKFLRDAGAEELAEEPSDEEYDEFLEEIKKAEVDEVISEIPTEGKVRASQQREWRAVLNEVLSDEQLAAWEKHEEEEKAKNEERFAKLIELTSENYRRQYGGQMDPIVEDIISTVGLDEGRSKKLEKMAEKAIDAFVDEWKKKAKEYIDNSEESRREAMLKRGYVSIGIDSDSMPQKQKVWLDGVKEILTDEERASWENALSDRESRRQRSATLMMLAAIDEVMALTGEQRKQLEPLLQDKAIEPMTTQLKREYWGSMNVTRVIQYAKEADQKKIREILDEPQWRRWQSALNPKKRTSRPKPKQGEAPKGPVAPDPIAVEKAITAHLYQLMRVERERILSNILVQAEDAGRVLSLGEETRELLQTAAKGAAEEELDAWANNMDTWVRRSIKDATAADIDQRLRNLGSVRFGRKGKAIESPIWKAAIRSSLTDEQQEIWMKEVEKRRADQQRATVSLIVTQLDNAARLTAEQVKEIQPLIKTSIDSYGPDINRYFSSWSSDTPWYLNSYYNMIPFQGIPEKQAKEVLTKAQWKVWEERFQSRVSHYWDQVLEYHEQRMKAEKKKEEDAAKKSKEQSNDEEEDQEDAKTAAKDDVVKES